MTVKEAAVKLGLSKPGLMYYVRKLPEELRRKGADGSIELNDTALDTLRSMMRRATTPSEAPNQASEVDTPSPSEPNEVDTASAPDQVETPSEERIIDAQSVSEARELTALKSEIDSLRHQLEAKDKLIAELLEDKRQEIATLRTEIDRLHKALDQEQQLQLESIRRIPERKTLGTWLRNLLPGKTESK